MTPIIGVLAIAIVCIAGGVLAYRRFRGKAAVAMLPVVLLAPMAMAQCAPAPAPNYSGVGHCYTEKSTNGISGFAACSAAQANGYTRFRSVCYYTLYIPGQYPQGKTTTGAILNPPDATANTINFPELTREMSRCPVPDVTYLPAGSYPVLDRVSFELLS